MTSYEDGLWVTATADQEAEHEFALMSTAMVEGAPVMAFLMEAHSSEDFANRLDLMEDRLHAVASVVAEVGTPDYTAVIAALPQRFFEHWQTAFDARQAASQARNAPRAAARSAARKTAADPKSLTAGDRVWWHGENDKVLKGTYKGPSGAGLAAGFTQSDAVEVEKDGGGTVNIGAQDLVKGEPPTSTASRKTASWPVIAFEDDDEFDQPECPACGGPGVPLGGLGKLMWYRCRDCGLDFNTSGASRKTAYETHCPYCGQEGCSPNCPGPGSSGNCPDCGSNLDRNGKCSDPQGCGYGWDNNDRGLTFDGEPRFSARQRKTAFVTITQEYTGAPDQQYVVRQFGDQFLQGFATRSEAEEYAASIGHSVGTPDAGTEGGWPFQGTRRTAVDQNDGHCAECGDLIWFNSERGQWIHRPELGGGESHQAVPDASRRTAAEDNSWPPKEDEEKKAGDPTAPPAQPGVPVDADQEQPTQEAGGTAGAIKQGDVLLDAADGVAHSYEVTQVADQGDTVLVDVTKNGTEPMQLQIPKIEQVQVLPTSGASPDAPAVDPATPAAPVDPAAAPAAAADPANPEAPADPAAAPADPADPASRPDNPFAKNTDSGGDKPADKPEDKNAPETAKPQAEGGESEDKDEDKKKDKFPPKKSASRTIDLGNGLVAILPEGH